MYNRTVCIEAIKVSYLPSQASAAEDSSVHWHHLCKRLALRLLLTPSPECSRDSNALLILSLSWFIDIIRDSAHLMN